MTERNAKISTRFTFKGMLLPYEYMWKADVNESKKFTNDSVVSTPRERDCHTVELSKRETENFHDAQT